MISTIEKIITKENGRLNSNKCKEIYFRNHEPALHEKITRFAAENGLAELDFNQILWHFMHGVKEVPICGTCKKKPTKFVDVRLGYLTYCSTKCISTNDGVKLKKKKTYQDKYGVDHIFQSSIMKDAYMEKLGVDNPSKLKSVSDRISRSHLSRSDEQISESNKKRVQTTQQKYKVDHVMQDAGVRNKLKETFNRIYNADNPMQSQQVKNKARESNRKNTINKLIEMGLDFIRYDNDSLVLKCDKCGNEYKIKQYLLYQRFVRYKVTPCTICNPIESSVSQLELEFLEFIKTLNIKNIITNTRLVIPILEIDVYLPDYNLAFEFNGLHWHSELFKDKNYHLDKKERCASKNINLIHIFEDDWKYRKEIVKSRIRNLLGMHNTRIYARHTIIKEIDPAQTDKFLTENHTQGSIGSSVKIALYHNDKIVSMMIFGKQRKALGQSSNENVYELLRFCNEINTSIPGAASKLLKYFILKYKPKQIISYADRCWSNGNVYKKLGLKFVHNSPPNYWYIRNDYREHRFKYRKSELVKQGFDANKSEHDIMIERNIPRIYDCGSIKFIYEDK